MHGEGEISAKIIWTGKIKAVPLHRNSKKGLRPNVSI